jgi:peptidoglycan/LPS O-acetylase OafA/YrhL
LPAKQLQTVQLLRFVAALAVALYHVQLRTRPGNGSSDVFLLFEKGGLGVDLFFVISGLVIYLSVAGKPFVPARFLSQRFWRIYPPYWAVLAMAIFIAVAQQILGGNSQSFALLSPESLAVSTLLLPTDPQVYPVAWTLAVEVTFYLIFTLAYLAGGLRAVVAALLAWYALAVAYSAAKSPDAPMIWMFHTIVLEFLFGVAIAALYRAGRLRGGPALTALGLALFAAVLVFDLTDWRREFCYGIPAAVLMAGAVQLTWRVPRILLLGGESSYLLYLLHPLVYSVMAFSIGKLGVDAFQNGALMLLMLLSAVGLSMAATLWIERPYIAWYKARRHRIAGALAAKG